MSDRFHTEIEIGGPVTSVQLRTIAELTGQVGMSCDWSGEENPDVIEKALQEQLAKDARYLTVNDPEVSHEFEADLTDYLIDQKIPWNKRVDAKYEYDAEFTWWRPGMKRPETWCYMDSNCQNVHVSLELLLKWRKQRKGLAWVIKELKKVGPPMDEAILIDPPPTDSAKVVDTTMGGG
jgi:hypothetical protein